MEKVFEYRSNAAALRREAANLNLEQARRVKLAAAVRREALAIEIETVIAPSQAQTSRDWIF